MRNGKILRWLLRRNGHLLRKLAWSDHGTRLEIQRHGVNVLPINFYSNVPALEEIESSFEYASDEAPYRQGRLLHHESLTSFLMELTEHAHEFDPPREGDEERSAGFFWGNSQFSHSDAMAYYCFLRRYKPRTVLEVGSGFSTLVALEAMARNGCGRVVCVEPYPRPFLRTNPQVDLVQEKVQVLNVEFFRQRLQDGDVLFIDSTHTVKTGSDCLHLYLRILPHLGRDVLVHAHDVFLPFGMPIDWLRHQHIYWTEQYLLLALLTDNPRARVLFGSAYHHAFNRVLLERMMAGKWTSGGGSFWFEYLGSQPIAAARVTGDAGQDGRPGDGAG